MSKSNALADGTYLRQHIHGDDAIAPQLRGYLPEHDKRYLGIVVRNGRIAEVVMAKPLAKRPTPTFNYAAEPEVQEDAPLIVTRDLTPDEVVNPEIELPPAPVVELHLLKKGELEAMCKEKGLSPFGSKAELIGRLRAAEADA